MSIVGIDLGTTNSLIGVIEKGRPRLFKDETGSTMLPSVVRYHEKGAVVGSEAKADRSDFPHDTIFSAKRFIGRSSTDREVQQWMKLLPFDFSKSDEQMIRFKVPGRTITPIEVGAEILKKLKKMAERETGTPIQKAVITVPAYFNDAQRKATKVAGELAGLEVARIINEPTAACLAYGLDKKTQGNIAVFDLGGGTFDISILRVQDGIFEVLATNGDTALGGDDFDHAIFEKLATEISTSLGRDPRNNAGQSAKLLEQSEELKRNLSFHESAVVRYSLAGKTFQRTVTRTEMLSWVAPILKRLEGPCLNCLEDAGLKSSEITDAILVGGSTRMPAVRELVQALFRREPISTLNPDEVVAMGAAVQGNILSGQMGGMLLLDVIPLSLGIETMGGVVEKIIHRNSTIPVSATGTFSTYVDGQTAVGVHVLQGERELAKDNRSLAKFNLTNIPAMPAGIPKIEVEFIVDANGILNVRAIELRTSVTASVAVNPSFGLTDAEVEKMLMDSFDFAESDFNARFLAEARTEADSLLRATEKSLTVGEKLISSDEKAKIDQAVEKVRGVIGSDDFKIIRSSLEELNETTKHMAELVLDYTVRKALKDRSIDSIEREKK